MGFAPKFYDDGGHAPFEYLPVSTGETVALGEALVLTSGKLTKCGATTAPTYIAMEPVTSAPAGTKIAVIRVQKNVIYETELKAASASIAAGAKYTLHTDGLGITATTTSGVAEVVDWDGKASGDAVRVRF